MASEQTKTRDWERLVERARVALNEHENVADFERAASGHPDAEETIARVVLGSLDLEEEIRWVAERRTPDTLITHPARRWVTKWEDARNA